MAELELTLFGRAALALGYSHAPVHFYNTMTIAVPLLLGHSIRLGLELGYPRIATRFRLKARVARNELPRVNIQIHFQLRSSCGYSGPRSENS